ncbi:protein kinase domain-containing protein [Mesorhizobium sp. ES1-4]|uniref:protein kinase domain-containing protein n=1 Tax=Mesorhizobium sp. ES1-4 TaxID=2876627 RepID=UPI001CCB64F6|nr:protein kinase [Mesorhizobium sp. ES1-4]MBZ9795577.1 protein kinase [Mesorhizobium sp. ES1-4]
MDIELPSRLRTNSIKEAIASLTKAGDTLTDAVVDVLLSEELTAQYSLAVGDPASLFDPEIPRDKAQSPPIRGCLQFFMLHQLATLPDDQRDYDAISRLINDPDFLTFFCDFYAVPEAIGLKSIAFYAAGTTSFIFKALTKQYGQCALKVIQAPYVRIPSIRRSTLSYATNYGIHIKHSPRVHDSSDTWIVMDFIDGCNLHEYMAMLRLKETFLGDSYIAHASNLFHLLNEALDYYQSQKPSMIHGDLTPFNIMVVHEALSPVAVKLIDFGQNYVLKDRVGTRRTFVEAFSRTELFTAPEVVSGKRDASLASDLYSLGMSGLDMLSAEPLRKDSVGTRLREIWQNPASIGIAEIIEDLVDENPDNRALILRQDEGRRIYLALDHAIQDHVQIYRDLVANSKGALDIQSQASRRFLPDVWKSAKNIRRIMKSDDINFNNISRIQSLSGDLNVVFQSFIVFSFVLYTSLDIKFAFLPNIDIPFSSLFVQIVSMLPKAFVIGDFWGNLPGRCVALTFGLVAARYYANIFAPLRVTDMPGALQTGTNLLLRLNAISYFLPIIIAIVYRPVWWPFCAFVGTVFPAINNLMCWLVARSAGAKAKGRFSVEGYHYAETERFLRIYREWWILWAAYSAGIGAIGILLQLGIAKDEAIYAAGVCLLNIFKVYRNNCASEAPFIAGNLSRLFFAIRRSQAKKAAISHKL